MKAEVHRRGLVLALGITALLSLPSLRWPVISDDEGIYDSMAQVVNSGGIMYKDALDHHPPGSVYVYAAIERWIPGITSVHLVGLLVALLTSFGLYLVARELMKRE